MYLRDTNLKLPPVVTKEVENYLSTRYMRFLDYANYHSALAGMDQQGGDVLNEVLLNLLAKDPEKLTALYSRKKGGYRELDYFVLRMIKLNCHSATSPYRFKYKVAKKDENIETPETDQSDLSPDNEFYEESEQDGKFDDEYEEFDKAELICARFQIIRDVLDDLKILQKEKEIFKHKFFLESSWSEWEGPERTKQLQAIFKKVRNLIIEKIKYLKLSYTGHIAMSSKRINDIKNEYSKTLFPSAFMYSKRYQAAVKVKEKYELKLNQINGKYEH